MRSRTSEYTHKALIIVSFTPSPAPPMSKRMHATMLMMSVTERTSQSWKRRVMSGLDASGISSGIEWNTSGKTVNRAFSTTRRINRAA